MKPPIKTALAAMLLLAISCKKESTLQSSHDKNSQDQIVEINDPGVQASIKIGTQKWMTRNLNVTHYRNGDLIPHVTDPTKWASLTTGAWCYYKNDHANGAIYGKLYNWYAVNDPRGLAPAGWHIPSDSEWTVLSTHLGGDAVAGGKLKDTGTIEAGTGLWYAPNTGATNKTGFTGLPGGYRKTNGGFDYMGYYGYWWSSTEGNTRDAWVRALNRYVSTIDRYNYNKRLGFSVRCIKD
jgi:uncharacterized protein (TIGR02145 family)